MLYNNLSTYLKARYGERVFKICIDGGFTCPNRDGSKGRGGCSFCGERGAGEHLSAGGVREQVERYFRRERRANKFIAYFQSFTNTYAPLETLKDRYDSALIDDRIVALAIGTRPDCVTDEVAGLIKSYQARVDTWVELGLHTASDATAMRINRGYASKDFTKAVEILNRHGIGVVAHIIIGLPGEGRRELEQTVAFLGRHRLMGIKIHCLYVMDGTALAEQYRRGEIELITMDEYAERAAYVLAHLPPDLIIHKLTGDCPKPLLVAPAWNLRRDDILTAIRHALLAHKWHQGGEY